MPFTFRGSNKINNRLFDGDQHSVATSVAVLPSVAVVLYGDLNHLGLRLIITIKPWTGPGYGLCRGGWLEPQGMVPR